MEIAFSPRIESGGEYELKLTTESNNKNISADVIVLSSEVKYREYCCTASRTLLIDSLK
jgi:nucleosome binding factor SPN SPT16 subunit